MAVEVQPRAEFLVAHSGPVRHQVLPGLCLGPAGTVSSHASLYHRCFTICAAVQAEHVTRPDLPALYYRYGNSNVARPGAAPESTSLRRLTTNTTSSYRRGRHRLRTSARTSVPKFYFGLGVGGEYSSLERGLRVKNASQKSTKKSGKQGSTMYL